MIAKNYLELLDIHLLINKMVEQMMPFNMSSLDFKIEKCLM